MALISRLFCLYLRISILSLLCVPTFTRLYVIYVKPTMWHYFAKFLTPAARLHFACYLLPTIWHYFLPLIKNLIYNLHCGTFYYSKSISARRFLFLPYFVALFTTPHYIVIVFPTMWHLLTQIKLEYLGDM